MRAAWSGRAAIALAHSSFTQTSNVSGQSYTYVVPGVGYRSVPVKHELTFSARRDTMLKHIALGTLLLTLFSLNPRIYDICRVFLCKKIWSNSESALCEESKKMTHTSNQQIVTVNKQQYS